MAGNSGPQTWKVVSITAGVILTLCAIMGFIVAMEIGPVEGQCQNLSAALATHSGPEHAPGREAWEATVQRIFDKLDMIEKKIDRRR